MDPAALGTTIIGLEAVRARDALVRTPLRRRSAAETLRSSLAITLRRLADLAEPTRRSVPGGV